jgi:hypothetical protein
MTITHAANDTSFRLTYIYGPTKHNRNEDFFSEILADYPPVGTRWIANGDINQIYRAQDKNKRSCNRIHINRFCATLHQCELNKIHLQKPCFTIGAMKGRTQT